MGSFCKKVYEEGERSQTPGRSRQNTVVYVNGDKLEGLPFQLRNWRGVADLHPATIRREIRQIPPDTRLALDSIAGTGERAWRLFGMGVSSVQHNDSNYLATSGVCKRKTFAGVQLELTLDLKINPPRCEQVWCLSRGVLPRRMSGGQI